MQVPATHSVSCALAPWTILIRRLRMCASALVEQPWVLLAEGVPTFAQYYQAREVPRTESAASGRCRGPGLQVKARACQNTIHHQEFGSCMAIRSAAALLVGES